jgi:hypothetical protein
VVKVKKDVGGRRQALVSFDLLLSAHEVDDQRLNLFDVDETSAFGI